MTREPGMTAAARALFAAALFAYPATLLVVPYAPGIAVGFLLIASLALAPAAAARRAELARPEDWLPLLGIGSYLLVATASALAWDAPRWVAINNGRLLAALALGAAIRLLRPPQWLFYAGCAVGAIGAGGYAAMQSLWEGVTRASGPDLYFGWQRATIFGGLSVVLGVVPLLAGPHGWPPRGKLLLAAGVAGGIAAAVLSGSRGAWLAGAVLLVWHVGRTRPWAALALCAAIVGAWTMVPMMSDRWSAAFGDLVSYEQGRTETALGLRFDMWKAALSAFAEHPLAGVGPAGFQEVLAARVRAGIGPAQLVEFGHAHSELLHALATGGGVGGAVLLAAYWLPWRYFRRAARSGRPAAGRAGMALVAAFFILGLTDTLFVHKIALTLYVVGVCALLGYAGMPRQLPARDVPPGAAGRTR